MRVLVNEEIDDDLLWKIGKLEEEVFGVDLSVGPEALLSLHVNRDGVFCLLGNDDEPIAFADVLFLSDEQTEQYLIDKDFKKLKNIGPRVADDNILYLFGLAILKKFRSTGIVRDFARSFASWLDGLNKRGVKMKYIFAETTSTDGVRFSKALGLVPVNADELDKDGLGFYYSPDHLEKFIKRFAK